MSRENNKFGNGVQYNGARAMKVHVDKNGNWWLCDKHVDGSSDFAKAGCWDYSAMPFDRND